MPDLTRLRSQVSMYSAATAVLLGVFCLLLVTDVSLNNEPEFGVTWTLVLAGISAVMAIFFLFLGDRAGPWPALLVVTGHAVPALLYLTVLETPMSAVGVILQLPVIALYLGGFLKPLLARATQAIVLLAFMVAVIWDPFDVVYELNGGKSLPSMLVFTWLCLEAGVFVQRRFRQETHIDQLTGLNNRRSFLEHADIERSRANRTGTPICLVMVDLDDFKYVNDTKGHNAGDRLLRELAQEWRAAARANDVLCRVGGDEFIFILPDTALSGAHQFLTRISEQSSHPWSWGLVEWHPGEKLAAVIVEADKEMYRSKTEKSVRSPMNTQTEVSIPAVDVLEVPSLESPMSETQVTGNRFTGTTASEEPSPSI